MAQHSVFLVALVAVAILWGTGNDTLLGITLLIAVVGGVLSLASRMFALRQARERRSKAISGLRLRKRPASEIEEIQKKPIALIESDYEFVPGWITYVNVALALVSVLILAYAIVIRFFV